MNTQELRIKVLKLKEEGKSAREISEWFNSQGITMPRGNKWTPQKVFNYVHSAKKSLGAPRRAYKKRTTESYVQSARTLMGHRDEETIASEPNSDILAILDSTKWTDRQKVEAAKALLR